MFWKDILPPRSRVKCKRGREAEVDPLHTIKIYRGNKGMAPLILKLGTRLSQVVNFMPWLLYPWERTPAPNEQESGWAPQPVWTYERREKSLDPAGIRIPYRPVHNLVNNAVNGGCSSKAVGTTYQITVSHLSKPQVIHKTTQCYNILSQQAASAGTDEPIRE
jgi:hypothetical protein